MEASATDRIVEAAAYLLAQGDRAGAEGLLSQALRLEPQHGRAQETMRRLRSATNAVPGAFSSSATPAPPLARPSTPSGVRPAVSRTQGLGPSQGRAPASGDSGLRDPRGLDLEAVRSAAARWREDLSPAPEVQQPEPAPAAAWSTIRQPREWSVLVLTGRNRGQQLSVGPLPMELGRGAEALDLSDDPSAFPQHALLVQRGDDLYVVDGGSPSGTWHTIEGAFHLEVGESFSVGQQRLRYLGPLEAPASAAVTALGGPLPAASWRLEQTLVGLRPGRVWLLRGIVTVGRENALLGLGGDPTLAAQHADLRPSGDGLDLVDRSEGLGTWVCVPAGGEWRVEPGALLRIGSTVLQPNPR